LEGISESNLVFYSEILNQNIMNVELCGILRKFDAIGQSIVREEMTLDEGLVRYREYLEVVKGSVNENMTQIIHKNKHTFWVKLDMVI